MCHAGSDAVEPQGSSLCVVVSIVRLLVSRIAFLRMPKFVLVLALALMGVARSGDVEPYHVIDC